MNEQHYSRAFRQVLIASFSQTVLARVAQEMIFDLWNTQYTDKEGPMNNRDQQIRDLRRTIAEQQAAIARNHRDAEMFVEKNPERANRIYKTIEAQETRLAYYLRQLDILTGA